MTKRFKILSNPLEPPYTSPSIILTTSPKESFSKLSLDFLSIRIVPTRSIVETIPKFSAALMARYAVPSLNCIFLAIVRTEIFSPTGNDSIYSIIRWCLVDIFSPPNRIYFMHWYYS